MMQRGCFFYRLFSCMARRSLFSLFDELFFILMCSTGRFLIAFESNEPGSKGCDGRLELVLLAF